MSTKDTLSLALTKLQANYLNISKGLAQANAQIADLRPDVLAAAKLLVDVYKHPEGVMAIIKSVGQQDGLRDVKDEISVLIAALQVQIGEGSEEKLSAQVAANNEVLASPLSPAGPSSQLSPADQATLAEVAAALEAPGNQGDQG